jgi:hypothetical protein
VNTEADRSRFVPVRAGDPLDAELLVFGRCAQWLQREHADRCNRMTIAFPDDHAGKP